MIQLDAKPGTTVWVFDDAFGKHLGAYRGVLSSFRCVGPEINYHQAIVSVPVDEKNQYPIHLLPLRVVYLTEAEATRAYSNWLMVRGKQIRAELQENAKKFLEATNRMMELSGGAPEREVRS